MNSHIPINKIIKSKEKYLKSRRKYMKPRKESLKTRRERDYLKLNRNQMGQTLVEYLILVALMAVASIGIVRSLNQTVNAKFATITYALQGSKKRKAPVDSVEEEHFKKKDLSNFMNGASRQKSQ